MSKTASTLGAFKEADISKLVTSELSLAAERFGQHKNPEAILLAGQPGAGKTMLSSMFKDLLHGDAASINGDDYRRFHPNYRKLHDEYGADAVGMTSAFSNAVVERLIDKFSDHRFHMVVEGTGRDPGVPKSTARLLTGKGYTVELAVIAVRPEISLASTLLRFYQMNERGTTPRATALSAHDHVVEVLPGNLDVLRASDRISRIRI